MTTVLGGCKGSGAGGGTQDKDTFVAAFRSDFSTFDPSRATGDQNIVNLAPIYEQLVAMDQDQECVPLLAKSWELTEAQDSYIFTLQEGVTFHNGTPLTPDDVVFSAEHYRAAGAIATTNLASAEVVGENQVKLTMVNPGPTFLKEIAAMYIMCKEDVERVEAGGEGYGENPIGTGKYKFVSYSPANETVFIRNDEYWGEPAKIKNMIFRIIPDESTRALSMRTGDIDLCQPLAATDVASFDDIDSVTVRSDPGGMLYFLSFDLRNEYFANPYVRKAISYLIDREAINTVSSEGTGGIAYTLLSPQAFGYNEDYAFPDYNVQKAKEMMELSGIDGFSCEILTTPGQTQYLCEVLQAACKEINIDISIQALEFPTFLDRLEKQEFDMIVSGWTDSILDANHIFSNLLVSDAANNKFSFSNQEVDELVVEGMSEFDEEKRLEIYNRLQEIMLDECAVIPILFTNTVYAYDSNIEGLWQSPCFYINYGEFYFKE